MWGVSGPEIVLFSDDMCAKCAENVLFSDEMCAMCAENVLFSDEMCAKCASCAVVQLCCTELNIAEVRTGFSVRV